LLQWKIPPFTSRVPRSGASAISGLVWRGRRLSGKLSATWRSARSLLSPSTLTFAWSP
jgi:hypothetical protein